MLEEDLIGSRLTALQLDSSALCMDLGPSDKFFNSFKKKYVKYLKLDFIVDPNIILITSFLNIVRNHGKNQRLPITTPLQKSMKIQKMFF